MDRDQSFRARRSATNWLHRAIDFPDDHGWVCIGLVVIAGLGGYFWELATR